MPDASCRKLLADGLKTLQLPATDDTLDKLLQFIKLLEKWNTAYNLTAITEPLEMARLHILDSLAIQQFITGPEVIDIGTGAGLPGIPLAIFLPELHFVLLDSNAKKTRFVQQVKLELNLQNIDIAQHRAETYKTTIRFNSVISRAFASLQDFINNTDHLLADNGTLLAMKGQKPIAELPLINRQYTCVNLQVPGVDAERCLIKIPKT